MAEVTPSITTMQIRRRVIGSALSTLRAWYSEGSSEPPPELAGNPKFVSYDAAAAMIKNGSTLAICCFAANLPLPRFFRALASRHARTSQPHGLTITTLGGNGTGGKLPGSVDDILRLDGCVSRVFVAHVATHLHGRTRMVAAAPRLQVHIMPLGVISSIYGAMARGGGAGKDCASVTTSVGAGTVFDPRVGRGSPLTPGLHAQFVRAEADGRLTYSLPHLTVTVLNAAAADKEGNVYRGSMSMISDVWEVATAVRRNGGVVIVAVAALCGGGGGAPLLEASLVDAIVLDPRLEQTLGAPYASPWPFLTLHDPAVPSAVPLRGKWSQEEAVRVMRTVNKTVGATPLRDAGDALLGRLGMLCICRHTTAGARINIGTGLPEEVGVAMGPLADEQLLHPYCESGVLGGVAAVGAFFGGAVTPTEMISTSAVFKRLAERLDCVVLGGLEVDERGDVNVASKGGPRDYVGPGGFVDMCDHAQARSTPFLIPTPRLYSSTALCASTSSTVCCFSFSPPNRLLHRPTLRAQMVLFLVSFEARAKFTLTRAGASIAKHGKPKFVRRVHEVNFCAARARAAGKRVLYATHFALFQLAPGGLELIAVFPGVDVRRDILDASPAAIRLPRGGIGAVEVLGAPLMGDDDGAALGALLRAEINQPPPSDDDRRPLTGQQAARSRL